MINRTELRIGNLVGIQDTALHSDGCSHLDAVFEIEELRKETVHFKGFHTAEYYKDIKGIELTEELLLNCGFDKNGRYAHERGLLTFNKAQDIFWIGNKPMVDMNCEHLHQLQNLYFALTGEELEITI